MILPYFIAGTIFAIAAVWICTIILRRYRTTQQLIEHVDIGLRKRLTPYTKTPTFDRESLWHDMGQERGLWKLWWISKVISTYASRMGDQ